MSINFEQYYRGVLPISIDKSNFKVSLSFNSTLATTSGKLGINLGSTNTWTVKQTFEPQIYIYGTNVAYGYFNDFTLFGENNGCPISSYHDNTGTLGMFMAEIYSVGTIGVINKANTAYQGLAANSFVYSLLLGLNGSVYTSGKGGTIGAGSGYTLRNTLDNGSGGMSVAGGLTVTSSATFKSNVDIDGSLSVNGNIISNNNGGYVSAYNDQVLMFTGDTAVNGNGGAAGISISGRPRMGDWGEWLVLGEPNATYDGNVIQITGNAGIYTGKGNGITSAVTVRNTLDNGSGGMVVAGGLTVTSSATFEAQVSVAGELYANGSLRVNDAIRVTTTAYNTFYDVSSDNNSILFGTLSATGAEIGASLAGSFSGFHGWASSWNTVSDSRIKVNPQPISTTMLWEDFKNVKTVQYSEEYIIDTKTSTDTSILSTLTTTKRNVGTTVSVLADSLPANYAWHDDSLGLYWLRDKHMYAMLVDIIHLMQARIEALETTKPKL